MAFAPHSQKADQGEVVTTIKEEAVGVGVVAAVMMIATIEMTMTIMIVMTTVMTIATMIQAGIDSVTRY